MSMPTKSLVESKAYAKLTKLADSPYDLTEPHALQANNRLSLYSCRSELLRLHFATERVDDEVLGIFQDLADELRLVDQFKEMRRGAVLNRIDGYNSENRQVLHTACRDVFNNTEKVSSASAQAEVELNKLRDFLGRIDSGQLCNEKGEPFDTMVQVGIGGSDLGPRAMFEGLKAYTLPGRKVHFVANVDPDDGAEVLSRLNLSTTLVNIVSKSGTTLETLTNEKIVRKALVDAGLNPNRHCIAVTAEKSPMDNPEKYLRSFYMYDYIGGRFSSTSMVGAVVLGFSLGFSQLLEFLEGASVVDREAENYDIRNNVSAMLALLGIWNHNVLGCATLAVLPYSQALHRFTAHLQQCDMESNGKSVERNGQKVACKTGPIVWGEPGTNGQHAFYQLLHQGTEIVPVEFIGFNKTQYEQDLEVEGSTSQQKLLANLFAQMVALAAGKLSKNPNKCFPGNRPSCLLMADRLTPKVMGALLATYEAKIVYQGFAWNINSFDQEGVQLGKVLAGEFLDEFVKPTTEGESLTKAFLELL